MARRRSGGGPGADPTALHRVVLVTTPARRAVVGLAAVVLVGGCGRKVTRTLVPPARIETLDDASPFLKAHLADGSAYVLHDWLRDEDGRSVTGTGTLFDARRARIDSGTFRVPADSIVLFETNVVGQSGAAAAMTVMVGVTAVVAGICILNPKSCFGSCPTFYAPGPDGRPTLQAEGFSSSIAPALEATDVDMLLHTRPAGRDYRIRVTNEAMETHVIRWADLLAVPRPAGGRIFHTADGRFLEASDPVPPSACRAEEGDCLAAVLEADGVERAGGADSTDLAAREIVELEFATVPPGELGVVVSSRQTLLTTFLIYQALAWLGSDAGRFLAGLDAPAGGGGALDAGAVGRLLGGVELLVAGPDGAWRLAGSSGETGPIARDTRVVPLGEASDGPLRVRLRLTRGMWRLDQVQLVSLGDAVEPVRLRPVAVRRDGVADIAALEALTDPERTLVTFPGDAYEIAYALPADAPRHELFLEARGYYLEWMRREWLAEENPTLAGRLLLAPAQALRSLAPAFKRQEAEMERVFWNSRYGRD